MQAEAEVDVCCQSALCMSGINSRVGRGGESEARLWPPFPTPGHASVFLALCYLGDWVLGQR
jgi:hypothetical protein